jgi:hypothetical protein
MVKDYMSIKFLQLFKLIPVFVALAFMLTITWKGNEVKQKVNHSNMLPVALKNQSYNSKKARSQKSSNLKD